MPSKEFNEGQPQVRVRIGNIEAFFGEGRGNSGVIEWRQSIKGFNGEEYPNPAHLISNATARDVWQFLVSRGEADRIREALVSYTLATVAKLTVS